MKRILVSATAVLAFAIAVLWAAGQMEQARPPQLPSLMPGGALLYIEAKDLSALLRDWNQSPEKRAWLAGDDYQAFSRSRLFDRLSQAQNEFSAAAGIAADGSLMSSVAGSQSCLAVYSIGDLHFLYITRMSQHDVENTPLWALRSKFEQRSEAGTQFYVRTDPQSQRTAAFAAVNGWLILSTRQDLVAGALDRLQLPNERSMADEPWYAESVRQAAGPAGDLRMVLNLAKLVPSPYFRSYWVQQNITDMKQYGSAISDLYRSAKEYREERVLLREPGLSARATGDVSALSALAPPDAEFYSAQASPDADAVLATLRDSLLGVKPATIQQQWSAPPAPPEQQMGSAAMLDVRIDQAPVVEKQADPYEPLRALLHSAQPSAMLQVGTTIGPRDGSFAHIENAVVLQAGQSWDSSALKDGLVAALQPGLTAGRMGLGWAERSGATGSYLALDGQVPLYLAVRQNLLFIANDAGILESMLARIQSSPTAQQTGVTYAAVFHHSPKEQENFKALFARLDWPGNSSNAQRTGQAPAFFSGNIESLSQMFADVNTETMSERDEGSRVLQTVAYQFR